MKACDVCVRIGCRDDVDGLHVIRVGHRAADTDGDGDGVSVLSDLGYFDRDFACDRLRVTDDLPQGELPWLLVVLGQENDRRKRGDGSRCCDTERDLAPVWQSSHLAPSPTTTNGAHCEGCASATAPFSISSFIDNLKASA